MRGLLPSSCSRRLPNRTRSNGVRAVVEEAFLGSDGIHAKECRRQWLPASPRGLRPASLRRMVPLIPGRALAQRDAGASVDRPCRSRSAAGGPGAPRPSGSCAAEAGARGARAARRRRPHHPPERRTLPAAASRPSRQVPRRLRFARGGASRVRSRSRPARSAGPVSSPGSRSGP